MNKTIKYIDFHDVIECLIAAVETRDPYTSGHSTRVADISLSLAQAMGLQGEQLETIHMAAHMHDIGKIGVPGEVLTKEGALTDAEWQLIQMHPQIGYDILSRSEALSDIAGIVLHHHERWDGKGYPLGLKGNDIPLGSQIIAVADAIDAMLSPRPYREAMIVDACMHQIEINSGKQFDRRIASLALELMPKSPYNYTRSL
jgi:HD-GYP domain-containing protein (c-di-GMP phosphodiesterase class II)